MIESQGHKNLSNLCQKAMKTLFQFKNQTFQDFKRNYIVRSGSGKIKAKENTTGMKDQTRAHTFSLKQNSWKEQILGMPWPCLPQ